MKGFIVVFLVLTGASAAQAQYGPQGDLQFLYQRVQGFGFRSGSASFDVENANFNGGGFGFTFHLTPRFGLWMQTAFYGGVTTPAVRLRLINEVQGARLSTGNLGALRLYAKGGVGFARYVFEVPGFNVVRYGSSFVYGGGAEIAMTPGVALVLDVSQLSLSLPDLTGRPNRDKWDSSVLFTTGIALRF